MLQNFKGSEKGSERERERNKKNRGEEERRREGRREEREEYRDKYFQYSKCRRKRLLVTSPVMGILNSCLDTYQVRYLFQHSKLALWLPLSRGAHSLGAPSKAVESYKPRTHLRQPTSESAHTSTSSTHAIARRP